MMVYLEVFSGDIPIISPKEGNVLPMAPLTEGRIVPQRSIAEEPEQCGKSESLSKSL